MTPKTVTILKKFSGVDAKEKADNYAKGLRSKGKRVSVRKEKRSERYIVI
jgi:hypothetical protein